MKDFLGSAATFLAIAAVNLLTGILAARLLGPEGRGELAAIMLWPQLIASLGVALAVDAVVHTMAKREGVPARTFASSQALALLLSVPLVLLAGLASLVFNDHFRPEVRDAGLLYALLVPLVLAASVANGLFQGAGRFAVWNAMRLFAAIAYAGFVLVVWGAGWVSVTHIAMASLAGAGLTLAVLLVLLAREGWIGWRADPAEMRRIFVFCIPIAMGSAILVIGERIDQIVLSQTQDEAAFGLYVVAASLGGAANGFVGLLGALALPKIAAIEDKEARAAMLGRFLRLGAALGVVLAVMLAVLAAWVVRVLYGEAFVEAASLVRVLAVAAIPFGVKQLLIQGSKAYGQTAFLTRIELATVAAGVAALLALVPTLGTIGAAWSFVLSQSTGAIVAAVYARRHLDVDVLVLFKPHADDWRRAWDALTVRRP